MSSSVPSTVRHVLAGALMGTAEVIPGVSGGTMALIAGVYETLVGALSSLVSFGLALLQGRFERAAVHWRAVPWRLLGPLLAGMVGLIVLGARVIPPLMAAYPACTRGLFFGLVGASLFIPALRIRRLTLLRAGIGGAFAVAAFVLTGLPVLEVSSPGPLRIFLSAAVAICAMILPGISGAFLLEALGLYTPTLEALNGLEWGYVFIFSAGAAVGLGAFSKLLDWLLTHRHDATMAALVGLIAGALRALWPYGGAERLLRAPEAGEPVLPVLALALLGFGLVLGLLWWERRSARAPSSLG
ncbi:MAG: DUF368 domain-containing protein [Salinivenus sp.]